MSYMWQRVITIYECVLLQIRERMGYHMLTDLINRQDAIEALDTGLWGVEWDKALATAMLKDLPSAERKGKWIDMNTSTTMYMPRYKCSICGNWANHSNYCPNCGSYNGADMRGEEE